MNISPEIRCNAWEDGGDIPIEYSAPKESNIQPPGGRQPENRKPGFSFVNVPVGTLTIALVVHDILDGDPVNGVKPGWTHYTAIFSPEGEILEAGIADENETGWVGPYPVDRGEYHCTAYFLGSNFTKEKFTRACILEAFRIHGLGSANMVGKYTNPQSGLNV